MKTILKILYFLIPIIYISCNSTNNNDTVEIYNGCDSILNEEKQITTKFPYFVIDDTALNSFLDTIIQEEKKCLYYDTCSSCFIFTLSKDSISLMFQIESGNLYINDYSKCNGIFMYDSYKFIINKRGYDIDILKQTEDSIEVKYFDIDWENRQVNIDDRFSSWNFEYNENIISFLSHHGCQPYSPDAIKFHRR